MTTPRDRRLIADAEKLRELAAGSDLIDARPVNSLLGRPPDLWEVSFRCRGIAGANPDGSPVYSDYHRVKIELGRDYPRTPPAFRWLTPILHPNIESTEPHRVCINKAEWGPSKSLAEIVLQLGEMVQYKNYHAENRAPWPLDMKAAKWALQAERRGYFSKTNPVDSRDLIRPGMRTRITRLGKPAAEAPAGGRTPRVKITGGRG